MSLTYFRISISVVDILKYSVEAMIAIDEIQESVTGMDAWEVLAISRLKAAQD